MKNLSEKELLEKEKSMKMTTGLLVGILLILFIITLNSTIKEKEFDVLMIVPIALSTIVFTNYKKIKGIQNELSIRKN